jgi:hypothetical protein
MEEDNTLVESRPTRKLVIVDSTPVTVKQPKRKSLPPPSGPSPPEEPSPSPQLSRRQKQSKYCNHSCRCTGPELMVPALHIRCKLQKGLLARDPITGRKEVPKEDEMEFMSRLIQSLEDCPDLEVETIVATKIDKVLSRVIKLLVIPHDQEYKIRQRSLELLRKWNTRSSSSVTSTSSGPISEFDATSTLDFHSGAGSSEEEQGLSPSKRRRLSPCGETLRQELVEEASGAQIAPIVNADTIEEEAISGEGDTSEHRFTHSRANVPTPEESITPRTGLDSLRLGEEPNGDSSVADGWGDLLELEQRLQAGITTKMQRSKDLEAALKSKNDALEAAEEKLRQKTNDAERTHQSHVKEKARADVAEKACDAALKESHALRGKVESLEASAQQIEKTRHTALTERDELRSKVANLETDRKIAEQAWNNTLKETHELQSQVMSLREDTHALRTEQKTRQRSLGHLRGRWREAELKADKTVEVLQQTRQKDEEKGKLLERQDEMLKEKDQAIKEQAKILKNRYGIIQAKGEVILEQRVKLKDKDRMITQLEKRLREQQSVQARIRALVAGE